MGKSSISMISMGHLYHGYVSHNQRAYVFSSVVDYLYMAILSPVYQGQPTRSSWVP